MALIDRINERVEHDLLDAEINALIADAIDTIEDRYGATTFPAPAITASTTTYPNTSGVPLLVTVTGGTGVLVLVNGIAVAGSGPTANQWLVPAAGTLRLDYTTPATWTWRRGVVEVLEGDRGRLDLVRPADATWPITVVETAAWQSPAAVLAADYVVRHGGRTLERLSSSLSFRGRWAASVTVSYMPVDDSDRRDEVTIGLVQLAIARMAVERSEAGDVKTQRVDYVAEREKLLSTLAPRRGGLLLA